MRAQAEEETINYKIEYLKTEMDPNKRLTLEREAKDAARNLSAIIKSEKQPETKIESEPVQPES